MILKEGERSKLEIQQQEEEFAGEEDPQHCAQEQQVNNARCQQVRASRLTLEL